MSSKFKVGDRVRVYGWFSPEVGGGGDYLDGAKGEIIEYSEVNMWLRIFLDEPISEHVGLTLNERRTIADVHPKQCRRLVKKERRRIWVSEFSLTQVSSVGPYSCFVYPSRPESDASNPGVEFVEVRKRKSK